MLKSPSLVPTSSQMNFYRTRRDCATFPLHRSTRGWNAGVYDSRCDSFRSGRVHSGIAVKGTAYLPLVPEKQGLFSKVPSHGMPLDSDASTFCFQCGTSCLATNFCVAATSHLPNMSSCYLPLPLFQKRTLERASCRVACPVKKPPLCCVSE